MNDADKDGVRHDRKADGKKGRGNDLPHQTRLRSERRARFEHDGERPIGRNLALMGSLGWLIVIPALMGIAAGAWLDRTFHTGVFWTGALLMVGVALGCWMAWRRIGEE